MKQASHHLRNAGSVHAAPLRHAVGTMKDEAPEQIPSLLRLVLSFGDSLDEDALESWNEMLRPRRHQAS